MNSRAPWRASPGASASITVEKTTTSKHEAIGRGWNEREQAEECASMGGVCDENGNQTCVAQCNVGDPSSCQDVGFPDTWVCQTQGAFGGACVFP